MIVSLVFVTGISEAWFPSMSAMAVESSEGGWEDLWVLRTWMEGDPRVCPGGPTLGCSFAGIGHRGRAATIPDALLMPEVRIRFMFKGN